MYYHSKGCIFPLEKDPSLRPIPFNLLLLLCMARKNKESKKKRAREDIGERRSCNKWSGWHKCRLHIGLFVILLKHFHECVCHVCELIVGENHNRKTESIFVFLFYNKQRNHCEKAHSENRMHSLQFGRILWTNVPYFNMLWRSALSISM